MKIWSAIETRCSKYQDLLYWSQEVDRKDRMSVFVMIEQCQNTLPLVNHAYSLSEEFTPVCCLMDCWIVGGDEKSTSLDVWTASSARWAVWRVLTTRFRRASPLRLLNVEMIYATVAIHALLGALAKNFEKRLLAPSCLSVRLPFPLSMEQTRLLLDGFSGKLIFYYFSKTCRENSSFVKIWQV